VSPSVLRNLKILALDSAKTRRFAHPKTVSRSDESVRKFPNQLLVSYDSVARIRRQSVIIRGRV